MAHELDQAERAGTPAIEKRQPPHQAERSDENEEHVDGCARAHGGHHRHALGGSGDQTSCLGVDRRHQFALAQANEIAAVNNIAEMTFEPHPGAGEARHAPRQGNEIAAERAAGSAVVAHEDCGGALPQSVDGGEPGEAERLPRHNGKKRHNRNGCQYGADAAEPGGAVEQILDQVGDPEAAIPRPVASSRRPAAETQNRPAHGTRRRDGAGATGTGSTSAAGAAPTLPSPACG